MRIKLKEDELKFATKYDVQAFGEGKDYSKLFLCVSCPIQKKGYRDSYNVVQYRGTQPSKQYPGKSWYVYRCSSCTKTIKIGTERQDKDTDLHYLYKIPVPGDPVFELKEVEEKGQIFTKLIEVPPEKRYSWYQKGK